MSFFIYQRNAGEVYSKQRYNKRFLSKNNYKERAGVGRFYGNKIGPYKYVYIYTYIINGYERIHVEEAR